MRPKANLPGEFALIARYFALICLNAAAGSVVFPFQ
jgi:hypothetical protein